MRFFYGLIELFVLVRGGIAYLVYFLSFLFFIVGWSFYGSAQETQWRHSFSFGGNINRGNTDSELYNINFNSEFKKNVSQTKLKMGYNYGKENKTRTIDNALLELKYMRDFFERFYWMIIEKNESDRISDLDYRYMLGPGIGMKIIDDENNSLNFEAGALFFRERYEGKNSDNGKALRIAEDYEHKFNSKARFSESFEYFEDMDNYDDYIVKCELGLETVLTPSLNFKLLLTKIYNNVPALNKEKNDTSFSIMLVYNL